MICPKCKTKVSSEDTICPNCNLRLVFECPRCGSSNRLGSVNCKKCGFTFVKFCPKCKSANYASSSVCRKCGHEFVAEKTENNIEQINISSANPIKKEHENRKPDVNKTSNESSVLLFYITFINLEKTFEKYNTDEFKQKVIQNIKTTVKIAFNTECEFVNKTTAMFKVNYNKNIKILEKITQFEQEFDKFNDILEKTLDTGLSYKFAISTINEVRRANDVVQTKLGSDKDVIVSSSAYSKLSNDLSLIKISSDSYKMIFLEQKPVFNQAEDEKYDKALATVLSNLQEINSAIRAISINAPRGTGKTHLLNDIYYKFNKMKTNDTIIFYAQCSALTQISPYGLLQSFFISLFGCNNVLNDDFNMKSFEKKVLTALNLEKIDQDNLETLANLIYPLKKDYFENILFNKEVTYRYLTDVFDYIKKRKNIVFIIDDFDLIDESSYSFLKHLIAQNYFERDAKIVLGYKNQHSVAMYFQTNKFNKSNCINISLRCFNITESKNFVKKVLGKNYKVPEDVLSQIAYNAQGNIAYIEQILQYLFERRIFIFKDNMVQLKDINTDVKMPETIEQCYEERLNFLKTNFEQEYIFLNIASLLGDKLDYYTLSKVFELSENDFFNVAMSLEKKGYLKRKVDDIYGFKNSLTWSYCYIRAKEDEIIKPYAKKLLDVLENKIISTPLICPILAQIINDRMKAYCLWTNNLQYANYIGDINIYAMAQKQCLILLESVKIENFEYTRNNICERLGKLIYDKNPLEAKDYLTIAINAAQKSEDIPKVVDLSGYLIKSVYLTQDYNGVVEVTNNILQYFNSADKSQKKSTIELQIALIKTRKLLALLKLGSWEEIVSIVNYEINPVLQKNLNLFAKHKWISQSEIFYSWIEANIILAQSYSQQGSPLAFELIQDIESALAKDKNTKYDDLRVMLACAGAMANTSRGYFDESDNVLQQIIQDYSYIIESPLQICEWNVINIINKILRMDLANIKEELFETTAFANNCNDEVSKNFLKTLLAYVLLQEKSYLKAIEIATQEMQYFSSKKIALGALLAWYISAAATANNKADTYCLEICQKAIKICENEQNNNYFFKILFQELLAQAYLKLNDIENAKMYCDLALQSANVNQLLYLQMRLNALKITIANECLNCLPDIQKCDYAKNVIKMYNKNIDFAQKLNLVNYVNKYKKELTSFKAHCQLNRIIEDR